MGGSMTELNMKNKKQPLIAKIVDVSFVCIVILLMMASLSTLVIERFFQENKKNGILAYELQQLYIIPNAEPKEFNFNNVWYVNKNMLHCSVDNVSKDYKIMEALEKNGWRTFGKFYAKNNLVARISQQDQGVTIDIYYK